MGSDMLINDLLDDFPVLICVLRDDERRVLYCNKIANSFIGDYIVDGKLNQTGENELLAPAAQGTETRINFDAVIKDSWFLLTDIKSRWIDGSEADIIIGIDITENKKAEERLRANATIDGMTGIYNRKTGIDFLTKNISEVKKSGNHFTVCYLDLNDLKYTNDSFGHSAGDKYIQTVVSIFKSEIRQSDIFARMGGDEFLLVFPNCTYDVVEGIVESVVNKLDIINDSGVLDHKYSISYGISEVGPNSVLDVELILNVVDTKMYYMKEEYRRTKGIKE